MTGIPLLYPRHHSIAAFSAAFTVFPLWLFLALYAQWSLKFALFIFHAFVKNVKSFTFSDILLQTSLWGGESPKKLTIPPKQLPKINQFL